MSPEVPPEQESPRGPSQLLGVSLIAATAIGTEASIWVVVSQFQENVNVIEPTWQKVVSVVAPIVIGGLSVALSKLKNRGNVTQSQC